MTLREPRLRCFGASLRVNLEALDETLEDVAGEGTHEIGVDRARDVVDDALSKEYIRLDRQIMNTKSHLERDLEESSRLSHRAQFLVEFVS